MRTAIRLFRRQGYARTGLNEILRRSGAPKGSLYYYFPGGKEELGAAAVAAASRTVRGTLQQLAEEHTHPVDFLRGYFTLLATWLEASDFRDGCPIATTLLETVPDSELIRSAGERGLESWIEVLETRLGQPGEALEQTRERARTVVAAIEGALLLSRVQRSRAPLDQVARTLASLFPN